MAHPQNNFTSQFQEGASSGNAALTLNINGVPQTYTPQGTDQTIAISEPVVFEMTDSPTFAEINAVLAEHIPGYLHVAGGGIDYMVPYVGQSGANALYFAMVDAQTEVVRYWICNNGGPWSNQEIGLLGREGEYGTLVEWFNLGINTVMNIEFSCSDPVDFCIIGAKIQYKEIDAL